MPYAIYGSAFHFDSPLQCVRVCLEFRNARSAARLVFKQKSSLNYSLTECVPLPIFGPRRIVSCILDECSRLLKGLRFSSSVVQKSFNFSAALARKH